MTLGEHLQHLRKDRGLSQEEVAKTLFVSRQTISKWETNKAEPGVENLKGLADLYGVTLEQLTGHGQRKGISPGTTRKTPEENFRLSASLRLVVWGDWSRYPVCWERERASFYRELPGWGQSGPRYSA